MRNLFQKATTTEQIVLLYMHDKIIYYTETTGSVFALNIIHARCTSSKCGDIWHDPST